VRPALIALALLLFSAAPASADGFLPDPTSCHDHPTGGGIHYTYVGQRFGTCATAHGVAMSYMRETGCHRSSTYCRVYGGGWSCHTRYSSGYHVHCQEISGGAEVFMAWRHA
jgi:hypothetical protein